MKATISSSTRNGHSFSIAKAVLHLLRRYCSTNDRRRRYSVLACGILVSIAFIGHRIASFTVNSAVLYKHPLNEVVRECPQPEYEVVSSTWTSATSRTTKKLNICITTLTDSARADPIQRLLRWRNFDSLLDMTWPNKQKYCDNYGYTLFDESMSLDSSRPPSWSKIRAVRRLLTEETCDWVFWMDADTVIMNSTKRIEDFLPLSDSGVDLILTQQNHKHLGISWNAGGWLIRKSPWSLEFLDTWWNKKEFVKSKGLSESGDNAALVDYLLSMDKSYFDAHIRVPPRCLFNSVAKFVTKEEKLRLTPENLKKEYYYMDNDRYHKSDFVAHVAGRLSLRSL
jgi:galactosyl transferase GMA12/MNN10 family